MARGVTRIDYLGRDDPQAYAPLPDYPHDQRLTKMRCEAYAPSSASPGRILD